MLKVAMLGMGGISGSHRNAWKQFEDAKEMSVKQRKDGNPLHPSGKQGQSPGLSSPFFK